MFRLDRDGRLWIIYLRVTDDQYLELFSDAIGDRPRLRTSGSIISASPWMTSMR
jgi:hypothetical protein